MGIALMLSYFFPPLAGAGVQRSIKFAKYLPEQGWQPVVIAARPNLRNTIEQGIDPGSLGDLPDGLEVIRCTCTQFNLLYHVLYRLRLRRVLFEIERLVPFLHMDYKLGWYPAALRAARRVLARGRTHVIYSSSPPYSAHFLGRRLQRESRLPWVADFRDPWTLIASYGPPTPLHARLERGLEWRILEHADAIVANTARNRTDLLARFSVSPEKVHVIPNGFDPQDFAGSRPASMPEDKFVVACVGKFYETPNVEKFFQAFRRFSDEHREARLLLLGWYSRRVRSAAERYLMPDRLERHDRVSHVDAIEAMRRASLLLLNVPGENASHWVPGKLYEYLATGRPILFVGPVEGEAARILRETGTGTAVPSEAGAILQALEHQHRHWRAGNGDARRNAAAIARFDRRAQSRQLASLFDTVAQKGRA